MLWLMGLLSALSAGGGLLARFAVNRIWLRDFLERARHVRDDVVLELEQTVVDQLARARAADSLGGVEITDTEMRDIRDRGVKRLLELLGLAAVERALKLMGLPHLPEFVTGWAVTQVEAAVKRLSIAQAAAAVNGGTTLNFAPGMRP